jgi:hypothetical protein
MTNLIPSASEIARLRNDEKIVEQTARQVIKDFALFGMEVSFPENIHWAYDELFEQLKIHVHNLLETNNKLLLSLLYQIDVSERLIREKSTEKPECILSETITDLILERELKKVITRNYFKMQENK